MEVTVIAHQALLYGHIIAFALALAAVIKEDVHLLRAKHIDAASLACDCKVGEVASAGSLGYWRSDGDDGHRN
jgi:hypothetical protein